MNKRLALIAGLVCAACLGGCAPHNAPVIPPMGWIYTSYKAPLTTDFDRTDVADKKVGRSSTQYIRVPNPWFDIDVAWDRADIERAARDGKITKVAYADYEITSVLGIYVKFTTIVYGD